MWMWGSMNFMMSYPLSYQPLTSSALDGSGRNSHWPGWSNSTKLLARKPAGAHGDYGSDRGSQSLFPKHSIGDPATADMRPWFAAVSQDVFVVAPGVLQGGRQD